MPLDLGCPEGQLFPVELTPMPGVVAVCMWPPDNRTAGGVLLGGSEGPVGARYQPDVGVVASSGVEGLCVGDVVLVSPYDGLWLTHRDYEWIPEGRQLRLFGRVAGDAWDESIEALICDG